MAWKKRLKKWSGLSWEWPSAFKIQDYEIRMRTFIAKQFVFFLFASVISFIWSKWSFTKQQKKAIFLLRFSRRVEANARGSEERSGLFLRTAFFALLSLRAYASRFPPLAWKRQQLRLRHLTSKVSMVTVVLALPRHAILQITRSKRFESHQKQKFHKELQQVELVLCDECVQ